MGAQLGAKGAMSEMNMTPLIDIVLVVLIIMMVTIPIEVQQMGVKVPGPPIENQPPPPPSDDQLLVAVYADGSIALNRKQMTEDVLFYELTRRLRPLEHKNVFVDAHPEAPYERVVKMIDLGRQAGAAKVGLAKMKEIGPLAATSVARGAAPRGITIGSPTVVGALDAPKADAAIQPFRSRLESCYATALAGAPDLSGRVVMKVFVGPRGEIMEHAIQSSSFEGSPDGSPDMLTCMDTLLGGFKFEALGDQKTAAIYYPLLLSPG